MKDKSKGKDNSRSLRDDNKRDLAKEKGLAKANATFS
jgi:hypothetical protein